MKKILIIYSTFTGNTQEAATIVHGKIKQELPQFNFILSNIRDVSTREIAEYPLVIFGTSTWEDDNSPDTEKFLNKLATDSPQFSNTTFALFGLGDSVYLNFCAAVPIVKQALEAHYATIYPHIFTIDGYPTETSIQDLLTWAKLFIQNNTIKNSGKNAHAG
jgi:flavodoxin I